MQEEEKSFRRTASPWALLRTAVGPWPAVRSKLGRLNRTFRSWASRDEIPARFGRLRELGYIEEVPQARQIFIGAIDNFRYFILPGVDDFYAQQDVNFTFHQILRFLEDPASLIDPTGFLSERDTIIGHLLQVVHNDPRYDFEILEMFPDGLDELERQTQSVMAGTHVRASTLQATTEDPAYYGRLLEFVREFRRNREGLEWSRGETGRLQTEEYARAKRTFGTFHSFLRYCLRLPEDWRSLLSHLARDKSVPVQWAEPAQA